MQMRFIVLCYFKSGLNSYQAVSDVLSRNIFWLLKRKKKNI